MSSDPMAYGDVLLSVRICLHIATLLVLLGYSSEHRTRIFSSLLAFLLAGTSFAMAMQCITRFSQYAPRIEVWSVLFFGVVLVLVTYNGGNVAKILYQAKHWVTR